MGQRLPKICLAAGTTAKNPAPSWTDAASSLKVEGGAVSGAQCFAYEVKSSYKAQDRAVVRSLGGPVLVEGLKDTATRMNASIVDRMVILVIA